MHLKLQIPSIYEWSQRGESKVGRGRQKQRSPSTSKGTSAGRVCVSLEKASPYMDHPLFQILFHTVCRIALLSFTSKYRLSSSLSRFQWCAKSDEIAHATDTTWRVLHSHRLPRKDEACNIFSNRIFFGPKSEDVGPNITVLILS